MDHCLSTLPDCIITVSLHAQHHYHNMSEIKQALNAEFQFSGTHWHDLCLCC